MLNITIPSLCIICGKPASGKSYVIRYLMSCYRKKFDYGIIFSNTAAFNNGFDYVPQQYVHSAYSERPIKNLMELQKGLIQKGVRKRAFIIFDDCLSGEFNSDVMNSLVSQFRHYLITVIISTQYCYKALTPLIRECCTYACIFRQSSDRSVNATYESFGQHFRSEKEWKEYLMLNTGDHKFLFIDVNSQSDNIADIYKVYKCPDNIPPFKLIYNTKQ